MADHLVYLTTDKGTPAACIWYGDHRRPNGEMPMKDRVLAMIPLLDTDPRDINLLVARYPCPDRA